MVSGALSGFLLLRGRGRLEVDPAFPTQRPQAMWPSRLLATPRKNAGE